MSTKILDNLTPGLREELCNAINVLRTRGDLPNDIAFDFVKVRGLVRVRMWRPDPNNPGGSLGGVGLIEPRELLTAAGPRPVIMGVREFV